MQEITLNRDVQKVEKIFWIREAKEDSLNGKRCLNLTVTDGNTQRNAIWTDTDAKVEDMVGTFKKITGTILNRETLIIFRVQEVHYSQIDIGNFFGELSIPTDVMYKYLFDLTMYLPPLTGALCFSIIGEFERFTNRKPVTELELAARIQATEEAFETVISWQRLLQQHEDVDHRDIILAGVIIGSFEVFLENELLLPSWNFMPSEILASYFNHIAKEIHMEKDTVIKIKKVLHAMYYSDIDTMKNAVITNTFFHHS